MEEDPSTHCNHREVVVKHYHWSIDVDFDARILHCSATLTISAISGCSQLILDIGNLQIKSVLDGSTNVPLEHEIISPQQDSFGCSVRIKLLTASIQVGTECKLIITYKTSPSCSAVQWLEPSQTAGKKHPYLYTQCQPIHARSMLPCMDTPSIKTTYTAEVVAPSDLTVLMSAERESCEPHPTLPNRAVTKFSQKVPIPSYLIALVVGALEYRQVGPRSKVWCEKEVIKQAEWDFSETDKILCTAEKIAGPYLWGVYDILILPPSFPYGGMENPCLTFVSPTVLSATIEGGDKSAASLIVAHEVSHSWTGNLVTNVSWEHFWLNEGWTTYLERKIVAKLYGEKERHLRAINGWKALKDAIEHFKSCDQTPLTAMIPCLAGIHPDDAFSTIPYEKGSSFLFYLETLLGGPGSLDEFIKRYIADHKFSTIDSKSWKLYFLNYFQKEVRQGLLDEVDWDKWFYDPGFPPCTPQYDTTLADASAALAEKWASITNISEKVLMQFSADDMNMSVLALQEFLNKLLIKVPLPHDVLEAMDHIYDLSSKENSELKFRWLKLCLESGLVKVFPVVVDFVTKQGRMKFIRPLYRTLFECGKEGKELAVRTFSAHRSFYHSVAASQLEKDLQLRVVP